MKERTLHSERMALSGSTSLWAFHTIAISKNNLKVSNVPVQIMHLLSSGLLAESPCSLTLIPAMSLRWVSLTVLVWCPMWEAIGTKFTECIG